MGTVLDTRGHGYVMLFRDAIKAKERALRKRWGRKAEIPLMSHSLSDIDANDRWIVRDISGNPVAMITSDGHAVLIGDDVDEQNGCGQEQDMDGRG
jgi:hypothetical protein